MDYKHFEYGERLASRLKLIRHTPEKPKFFPAFGLEDLFTLNDKISSVTGTILIAVDGYESNSNDNGYDGLNDTLEYAFIVATQTQSDRPETIAQAFEKCRPICKQIRNYMFCDKTLTPEINKSTSINGIGPIGDNFYGCILSFNISESEDYHFDNSYFML